MTPRALVDACGTRRRLQALAVAGWSLADLARAPEMSGRSRQHISQLRRAGGRVTWVNHQRVTQLYDRLAATPNTGPRAHHTRLLARRAGWTGPETWGWADIDDPEAKPNTPRTNRAGGAGPDDNEDEAA